jgi:alpha,alpha-trehalose phosphorylase
VIAAEVGHLELASDYLAEAALMDLHDLNGNGGDGLHIASLAGGWIAVVAGFGGLRDHGDRLTFRPQLPPEWTRLRFGVRYRGAKLHVDITRDTATYSVDGAGSVPITHLSDNGLREEFTVSADAAVEQPWLPVQPLTATPTQPPGRAPHRASARAARP